MEYGLYLLKQTICKNVAAFIVYIKKKRSTTATRPTVLYLRFSEYFKLRASSRYN